MQEKNIQEPSIEDLFLGIQESFAQAQQRALEENKSFNKAEFFRLDKLGTYRLRVLPLAPNPYGKEERRGYEYPVNQLLMEIEKPTVDGKKSNMYVTVPRATDAGYSIDLIDSYRKMAVAMANDKGDDKLAAKIAEGSFGGGLKYTYGHALYILDMDERAKGIQLLTLSHSQFKDLDERKFKLWEKKLIKNPHYPCPISSVYNAYPIEIEKRKNGGKTEYVFSIDNESDNDLLSQEELKKLMDAPRIPDIIYRYSRYQFEATIEFLKQCDVKYGFPIMESQEMKDFIEKLGSELPKDDTSSFSFDKRNKDSKDNAENTRISIDALLDRYDELQNNSIGDKTEEGQELRTLIREFIKQEKLPVRVTRANSNGELLDMLEDALHNVSGDESEEAVESNQTVRVGDDSGKVIEQPRRRR